MTAFTSVAGASNWNNGASWTGGSGSNWPSASTDTATILANAVVTIPGGVTITCGAISCQLGTSGRTTIQINGELDLAGTLAFAGKGALNIGTGGKLDLAGNAITNSAADFQFNFSGTSGSHCTITDSVGAGVIFAAVQNSTIATATYTDVSSITVQSQFGKTNGSTSGVQSWTNCTFTGCGVMIIEGTATLSTQGLTFNNNDVRSPTSGGGIEFFYSGQALGTSRTINNNTFQGGSNLGKITISGGVALNSFSGNVIDRFQLHWPNAGAAGAQTLSGNFWSNTSGDDQAYLVSGDIVPLYNGEYFYYDGGNHVFGSITGNFTTQNNIHEIKNTPLSATGDGATNLGANWYLPGGSNTHTIKNCIFIGSGTPLSYTASLAPTITYQNNTSYMNNDLRQGSGVANCFDFSFGIETEGAGNLTGSLNYINNLNVDSDTNFNNVADTETAITLRNAVGSQVTSADFNGHAGYNNSGTYATTTIGYYQSRSNTAIPGVGTHDVFADPLFVNKNAALATWDTSLGGAGTAANAITQMLKANGTGGAFNAAYTPAALIAYVNAGLTPQNAAYKGTGQSGADIGALPVVVLSSAAYGVGGSGVIGTYLYSTGVTYTYAAVEQRTN